MKKFKINNFIAFTLSEMMIVILIFSVLSAAILPSIVGKKQQILNTDETPVTRWQGESNTYGNYFQNGNTRVYLGKAATAISSTYVASPTLILSRYSDKYVYNGRSDIELYNSGKHVGGLSSDSNRNILVGKYSSFLGGSGSDNVMLGYYAASRSASDSYTKNGNVVIGSYSTYFSSSGVHYDSVAIGYGNYQIIAPYGSTSIGYYTGAKGFYYTSEPTEIVSVGSYAGHNRYDSRAGIYIGKFAGAAGSPGNSNNSDGLSIGLYAGYLVSSSASAASFYKPVNIGNYAGYLMNNTGTGMGPNVNIGYRSGGYANSGTTATGGRSVNIGYYAGYSSTPNTSVNIGHFAGFHSAASNTNIGRYAGIKNSGSANVFITSFWNGNSYSNLNNSVVVNGSSGSYSTGSYNTFIGGSSAGMNSTGSYNTFIGGYVGYQSSKGTNSYSNITAIGNGCTSTTFGSNKTCISPISKVNAMGTYWTPTTNSTTTAQTLIAAPFQNATNYKYSSITLYASKVYAYSTTMTTFSDKRLKENIKPVEKSLEKVRRINVYEYSMKSDKTHKPKVGVIAQELKDIIPQAVSVNPNTKYFTVDTDWIVYTAMDAIKELDNIVQNLQSNVKSYVKQLFDLSRLVDNLESRLNKISDSHIVMQAKLQEIDKILSKMENK